MAQQSRALVLTDDSGSVLQHPCGSSQPSTKPFQGVDALYWPPGAPGTREADINSKPSTHKPKNNS